MAYYLAPALASLRAEINAAHPNRDKTSDGWIGDTAHAARKSDHNPDYSAGGVVRALDVDKDGINTAKLLAVAIASPSTEYVIWNYKIYTRANGFRAQAYTGSNPHDKHMHISIRHTKAAEAARKWGYNGAAAPARPSPTATKLPLRTVAAQVIAGKWGVGEERERRLTAAGYIYRNVQAEVNRQLAGGSSVPIKPAAPVKLPLRTIAAQVIDGKWGNGEERERRLKAAGYIPANVQAEVNRQLAGGSAVPVKQAPAAATASIGVRKTNAAIAQEVIDGKWGNNPERSTRLQKAGYSPTAVQVEVKRLMGGGRAPTARLSVSLLAEQVLAGKWGNEPERSRRLTAAGYNPEAVQAEVNKRV